MESAQVIALIAFLLVAVVVALLALRTGSILSKTRQAEGFRGEIGDLARRAETSLGDVSVLIDRLRRRDTEPEAITASLAAARDAVDRYADEARALGAPTVGGRPSGRDRPRARAGRPGPGARGARLRPVPDRAAHGARDRSRHRRQARLPQPHPRPGEHRRAGRGGDRARRGSVAGPPIPAPQRVTDHTM